MKNKKLIYFTFEIICWKIKKGNLIFQVDFISWNVFIAK